MTLADFIPPAAFVLSLTKECGLERRRPVLQTETFEVHYLDLTSLKLRVSPFTPFVVPKGLSAYSEIRSEQFEQLLLQLSTASIEAPSGMILVLGGELKSTDSLRNEATKLNIVVRDKNDLGSAHEAKDRLALMSVLSRALVQTFGRLRLSPYHSRIPAVAGSFFGRAQVLKQVFSVNDNFTFVGNRRIGKTSLLQEIKHRMLLQKDQPFIAELYGSRCHSTRDVLFRILKQIDAKAADKAQADPDLAERFPPKIKQLSHERPIVIFIDELDRLVELDESNPHELMDALREAFYKTENTRMFAAGFRRARRAMQDVQNPLYNFTKRVLVDPLSVQETREMVEKPLSNLGIDVRTTPLNASIYTETAGHPELVQICCTEIIRYFEEHNRIPNPTDLLDEIFQTEDFRERVFGAFLANTNSHEQLVSYLLMRMGVEKGGVFESFDFEIADIDRVLKARGIKLTLDELYGICNNLILCGVFGEIRGGTRLRFAIPQLARYCHNYNLDFMIDKSLDGVKQGGSSWSDPGVAGAESTLEGND